MTLRCPKCGSKRVIFLSTTDGTAVGSTDQRYLCKDCGYRGSLIIEPSSRTHIPPAPRGPPRALPRLLVIADLSLFALVLLALALNAITSTPGVFILVSWVAVFFVTFISFTLHSIQGSDEWYEYGALIITGILVSMLAGVLLGYDLYGTALLTPFGVMAMFIMDWAFIDNSEEEIEHDLQRLQKEIK